MRAKVSIPAWARPLGIGLASVALASCISEDLGCERLRAEIDRVQREGGVAESGLWRSNSNREGNNMTIVLQQDREGDFPYYYDVAGTRSCLVPDWTEGVETLEPSGWNVIVFRRQGWPNVTVREHQVQDFNGTRSTRSQLQIERPEQ